MMKRQTTRRRVGVTMIEAVASMLIVSGAMAASLHAVSGARASQVMVADRGRTLLLAESMMTEALSYDYMEAGTSTIGPDSGEAGTNIRNQYDDVDDFHGWTNDVLTPDGTPVDGFGPYTLHFLVDWVDPADPDTVVGSDQGAKRVTVTITRGKNVVAQLFGWATAP